MSLLSPLARRAPGRPRRLSLDAVVDAACDIGLGRIDMALVAERLGIGVATLYNYVDGKPHLVRLVAERLSRQGSIADRGQSWQDVLREHVAGVFAVNYAWPQLIQHLVEGEIGAVAGDLYVTDLLALLERRGIAAADGWRLFFEVNQLAIGSAVGARFRDAQQQAMAGASLPDDAMAMLGDYRPTLEAILAREERAGRARDKASGEG